MVALASHFESNTRLHLVLYVSVALVALVDVVSLVGIVCQLVKDKNQIVVIVSGNI